MVSKRNFTLKVILCVPGPMVQVQSYCLSAQGNFVIDFNENKSGPLGYKQLSQKCNERGTQGTQSDSNTTLTSGRTAIWHSKRNFQTEIKDIK